MGEYSLFKTAQKTAKENNLVLVEGNSLTKEKLLFDFSFLETLNIPEKDMEVIKKDALKHCSIANNTAFAFHAPDNWSTCNAIVDFRYQKVYNKNTGKRLYVIMDICHVKYFHGERDSVYDRYYTLNEINIDVSNGPKQSLEDVEL